jgi:hypothetical protein
MIGVFQTRDDNCVAACVATILGCRIEQVPDFDPDNWAVQLREWLNESGWTLTNITIEEPEWLQGLTLGAITMPGSTPGWKHCVVCRDGKIVWCPIYGKLSGVQSAEEYTILYPLEITRAFQVPSPESVSLRE